MALGGCAIVIKYPTAQVVQRLTAPLYFSVESWDMTEGEMEVRDWPDLLSDAPAMGGVGCGAGLPRLKRGQGSRHLGVDMAFNADNEDGANQRHKHFTSSGEEKNTSFAV